MTDTNPYDWATETYDEFTAEYVPVWAVAAFIALALVIFIAIGFAMV